RLTVILVGAAWIAGRAGVGPGIRRKCTVPVIDIRRHLHRLGGTSLRIDPVDAHDVEFTVAIDVHRHIGPRWIPCRGGAGNCGVTLSKCVSNTVGSGIEELGENDSSASDVSGSVNANYVQLAIAVEISLEPSVTGVRE